MSLIGKDLDGNSSSVKFSSSELFEGIIAFKKKQKNQINKKRGQWEIGEANKEIERNKNTSATSWESPFCVVW